VQQYLITAQKTFGTSQLALENLKKEYAISYRLHSTHPLVILNYHMIKSPKKHSYTKECRQLILEIDSWKIVGKSFTRFYDMDDTLNPLMIGMEKKAFLQNKELMTRLIYQTKEDGSIIMLFYYRSRWHLATRSTFADMKVGGNLQAKFTWHEYFLKVLSDLTDSSEKDEKDENKSVDKSLDTTSKITEPQDTKDKKIETALQYWASALDPHCSYIFELCGPYNQVVCEYDTPRLYLLAAFAVDEKAEEVELPDEKLDQLAVKLNISRPETHIGVSLEKLDLWFEERIKKHGLFEGFVIKKPEKGKEALRFKAKTSEYIFRHRNLGKELSDEDIIQALLLQDNQSVWDRDDVTDF